MSLATNATVNVVSTGFQTVRLAASHAPFGDARNPQGWDQLTTMYTLYRPMGMRVRLSGAVTTATTNFAAMFIRGYWSQNYNPVANDQIAINNRFTKSIALTTQSGYGSLSSSSNLRNVHGLTEQQWVTNANNLQAVTVSPLLGTYYHLHFVYPPGTQAFSYNYEIHLDLEIEFYQPRILVDE